MQRRVLVTGAARSGTTILGRIIALTAGVIYLLEPFNRHIWAEIPHYYPYIGNSTSEDKRAFYNELISRIIHLRNRDFRPQSASDIGMRKLAKRVGVSRLYLQYRFAQVRHLLSSPKGLLIKDPSAIFLSEFLASQYNFKVILTVRHPAAIMISRKSLGWTFKFDCWRDESDLYLDLFKDIDELMKNYEIDFITEVAFQWLTQYQYVYEVSRYTHNVRVIRHEDWCKAPISELTNIFEWLGLDYNDGIKRRIKALTSGEVTDRTSENLAKLEARDSKNLMFKWKNQVSQNDLDRIKEITHTISSIYYPEQEYWYM